MRQWTLTSVYDGGAYIDYSMCRHSYHDVTLSRDTETGDWYSFTSISPVRLGPYEPFDEDRELPDAITKKLRKIMEALT